MSEMLKMTPLPPEVRDPTDEELAFVKQQLGGQFYLPRLKPREGGSFEDGTSHIAINCVVCGGKGSFKFYGVEGGERRIKDYICPCLDQWKLFMVLTNAGLYASHAKFWWRDVEVEPKDRALVDAYLSEADSYIDRGQGLVLLGERGTGKTLLSALSLKYLISKGYEVRLITATKMLDTYTEGWRDREVAQRFHSMVKSTHVVAFDDLGKEAETRSNVFLPLIDEVLRHRVSASLPTFITSEYSYEEIAKKYGGSVRSLLDESVVSHWFSQGDRGDFRPKWQQITHEEAQQGIKRPFTLGGNPFGGQS